MLFYVYPRDPGSPNLRMVPWNLKYLSEEVIVFTPLILWQGDWIPRVRKGLHLEYRKVGFHGRFEPCLCTLRIRLYVRLERDYPYIPIVFGWDWHPKNPILASIGRDMIFLKVGVEEKGPDFTKNFRYLKWRVSKKPYACLFWGWIFQWFSLT